MIRIMLVEDHASLRQPLAFMLDQEPDFTVAAQAGTLAEARQALAGVGMDLAIIDLTLPDGDATGLIREARSAGPNVAVLVLTVSEDPKVWARAAEAGAAGVLHKSAGMREVVDAVRRVAGGGLLYSPAQLVGMLRLAQAEREEDRDAKVAIARLTPREREVLGALAEGLGDREIARRLGVSLDTARAHVSSIIGKFGVESRLQAILFALRHGAITIRTPR